MGIRFSTYEFAGDTNIQPIAGENQQKFKCGGLYWYALHPHISFTKQVHQDTSHWKLWILAVNGSQFPSSPENFLCKWPYRKVISPHVHHGARTKNNPYLMTYWHWKPKYWNLASKWQYLSFDLFLGIHTVHCWK